MYGIEDNKRYTFPLYSKIGRYNINSKQYLFKLKRLKFLIELVPIYLGDIIKYLKKVIPI